MAEGACERGVGEPQFHGGDLAGLRLLSTVLVDAG